ncbi:hypothetical protein QN277_026875 [Acacia crassicarpa]|nr:hypothetical protein QN277_026875 [Acacia crassicarpa]
MEDLIRWFRLLDQQPSPVETRPQHGAADVPQGRPVAAAPAPNLAPGFSNTGTQNMKGLINNTGFTTGNGNGSIIFGSFDTSTRNGRN